MKCNTLTEEKPTTRETAPANPVTTQVKIPTGLLGFEQIKDYQLVSNPGEAPFQWLRVGEDATLAFVVIDPFLVLADYKPELPQQDVEFLKLNSPEDAVLLNIVTVHGDNRATVNLKGPLVVNRHTGVGKQIVIANATDYSVQHPLPLVESDV